MRDWTTTIRLAQRLIEENGRVAQFVKQVSKMPDPEMPWRTLTDDADSETVKLPAVFVPPSGSSVLGYGEQENNLFKTATQIAIVAPAIGATYDLTTFHRVVEETGRIWRFNGAQKLQPGDTALLYFIGMVE